MSLFDKIFPRLSKRPSSAEPVGEIRSPFLPTPDEPKDPVKEIIREELNAKRVIHTYEYQAELDEYAVYLQQHKNDKPTPIRDMLPTETTITLEEEVKGPIGNPTTMWAYGVGGAAIGFGIAAVLMRKHVEPLTSLVYTSFAGVGGYVGSKLDQHGLLPSMPYLPHSQQTVPNRKTPHAT
jgi:hypothetical protein